MAVARFSIPARTNIRSTNPSDELFRFDFFWWHFDGKRWHARDSQNRIQERAILGSQPPHFSLQQFCIAVAERPFPNGTNSHGKIHDFGATMPNAGG